MTKVPQSKEVRRTPYILTGTTSPGDIFIFDSQEHKEYSHSQDLTREYQRVFLSVTPRRSCGGISQLIGQKDEVKLGRDESLFFPFIFIFLTHKENSCSKEYLPTNQTDDQMTKNMCYSCYLYPHENSQPCTPCRINREE